MARRQASAAGDYSAKIAECRGSSVTYIENLGMASVNEAKWQWRRRQHMAKWRRGLAKRDRRREKV
jgi:hypothetical protein